MTPVSRHVVWKMFCGDTPTSRKLSKIALNLDVFFAVPNFMGPAFQKLYICYDPCLGARRMENVL